MNRRRRAELANGQATTLLEKGQYEEALQLLKEAAALAPDWSTPCYNLGLVCKRQCRWEESLQFNLRATQIDGKNEAAWWNLGIAATALGKWDVARSAWRGFGVPLPAGEGPIELPCGVTPIRLNPRGVGEVVWADRLDPARAQLISIPFPESGFRWRDIVLNDGAPAGYRQYQGKDFPVFEALQLLNPSPFGTFIARVRIPETTEDSAQLLKIAAAQDGFGEDWSTSVRILCQACSEGRVHTEHDTHAAPRDGIHLIGIAARSHDHAATILNAWEAEVGANRVASLDDALPPGADG